MALVRVSCASGVHDSYMDESSMNDCATFDFCMDDSHMDDYDMYE
jgi:hypothetical protein